jgi:hypothetical protein
MRYLPAQMQNAEQILRCGVERLWDTDSQALPGIQVQAYKHAEAALQNAARCLKSSNYLILV